VKNLMVGQKASLKEEDYDKIAEMSAGFSGADMKSLCQDASYGPIRDIVHLLEDITPERVGYCIYKLYCYLGSFYLFLISEFNYLCWLAGPAHRSCRFYPLLETC
jgi:SpoVK/Ycf46/Vps4 family AAA+-type ATPase